MSVTHAENGKLVHGCSKCDRKFSHLFLLKNHEQSHLPYQQRQFICKKCLDGKRFPTLSRLKAHEKQARPCLNKICRKFTPLFEVLHNLQTSTFETLLFRHQRWPCSQNFSGRDGIITIGLSVGFRRNLGHFYGYTMIVIHNCKLILKK